jgi:hypothetical protein
MSNKRSRLKSNYTLETCKDRCLDTPYCYSATDSLTIVSEIGKTLAQFHYGSIDTDSNARN